MVCGWMTLRLSRNLLLFALQFVLVEQGGKPFFLNTWSYILGHFALPISWTRYMHLHHTAVSHRQRVQWNKARKSRLRQTEWIVCRAASKTSIWQTLRLDSKGCQFEAWMRRRKAAVSRRPDTLWSLQQTTKTQQNATSTQSCVCKNKILIIPFLIF